MNGIQIKSYLLPEHAKVNIASISMVDEIRRFSLAFNGGATSVYANLIEKIKSVYGSSLINGDEIRTYWQDEENELIGFSTDSEFQYAIDVQAAIKMSKSFESSPNMFKVYIKRVPSLSGKEKEPSVHFGVVCDACNGSIIGNRYKCSVCPDYDLCESCHSKNIHPEHTLNVITKPVCPGGWKMPQRGCRFNKKMKGEKVCGRQFPFHQAFTDIIHNPQFASNIPIVNNPEQLKNFGEHLKTFLDPFGIDVSYYVDSLNKKEDKPAEEAKKSHKTSPPKKEDVLIEPITSSLMDQANENEANKNDESSEAGPSAPELELIDLKKAENVSTPFEFAINALQNLKEFSNQPEQTTEEEKKGKETVVDGFNLIDIEKELKIIKAIEQLRTMGYTDDGGWLTRLASAKDGNINAVLDAISPFGLRN